MEAPLVRIRIGAEELALTWEEWEARVRDGRVPPEALICFEPVTGEAWVPAGDLEIYRSITDEARLTWQHRFLEGTPPLLTAALVGIQLRIWASTWVPGVAESYLDRFTNFAPPAYEDGESWRLLTMGILHTETLHIALNLVWLTYTGWNLERALGRRNLAVIYFASVLGGSLLSMLGSPVTRSLGASGGVFGLVAASVVFGFTRPGLLPERGRRLFGAAMLPYLVLMFWNGLMSDGTDNWSHFGGLMVGGLLAFVLDPEPLQRRAGWNRAWRGATTAAGVALLLGITLFGPRLHPLSDPHTARARAMRSAIPLPARDVGVHWAVPAGWFPGMTPSGDPGFKSPAGHRSYAVIHGEERHPIDADALFDSWAQRMRRGWPEAQIHGPQPSSLAGHEGFEATAEIVGTDGEARTVSWRGASRGIYTIEEIWEVEEARAGRLQPLRERLKGRLSWEDPPRLTASRDDLEKRPDSRLPQLRHAQSLLRVGEVKPALQLLLPLLDPPASSDAWSEVLTLLQWHPDHPQADALWARALRERPQPRTVVEVAKGLDAAGREQAAWGLLDLAWTHHPGDRTLRQARRQRGLSTALTEEALPWAVAYDLLTGERRAPTPVEDSLDTFPTLEAAEARGAQLARELEALHEAATAAWLARDPDGLRLLLFLRDGTWPTDPTEAIPSLRIDLQRAADGATLRWMPQALTAHLRDQPGTILAFLGPELSDTPGSAQAPPER